MPTALRRASGLRNWVEERDDQYRARLISDPAGTYAKRLAVHEALAHRWRNGNQHVGRRGVYPLLCCEVELWGDEGQHSGDCPGQS